MNVQLLIKRAFNELYNDPALSTSFLTPTFAVHALNDCILNDYWSVFQDKEYSYYKFAEQVLNIIPAQNIYPLPNGDPAQTDLLSFSQVPVNGSWTLQVVQGANTYDVSGLGASLTAASFQSAINAATGGTPTATQISGNYQIGFTILWDLTSSTPIVLTVIADNTGVGITDTTTPYNVNNLQVAFVTQMVPRISINPPQYGRILPSFNPNDKYNTPSSSGFIPSPGWQPWTPGSNLRWCFNNGLPDGNGYPTNYIRFLNFPNQALTLVYDGLRYPIALSDALVDGQINQNQIPDIPTHFGPNLVRRLVKEAFLRGGLDLSEINKEIMDMDLKSYAVESQGVQRQRPDKIRNVSR